MALKGDDIAKHNDAKSCWVIIHVRKADDEPWTGGADGLLAPPPCRAKRTTSPNFCPVRPLHMSLCGVAKGTND